VLELTIFHSALGMKRLTCILSFMQTVCVIDGQRPHYGCKEHLLNMKRKKKYKKNEPISTEQ